MRCACFICHIIFGKWNARVPYDKCHLANGMRMFQMPNDILQMKCACFISQISLANVMWQMECACFICQVSFGKWKFACLVFQIIFCKWNVHVPYDKCHLAHGMRMFHMPNVIWQMECACRICQMRFGK